jgi:hypothetical protein
MEEFFGDTLGSFTCFTPNVSSTVDYVIASEEILNDILYLRVSDFIPTLSDAHCKLSLALSARYKIVKNSHWVNTHSLLPNFHWSDDSPEKVLNVLNTFNIQSQLCKVYQMCNTPTNSQENIKRIASDFLKF